MTVVVVNDQDLDALAAVVNTEHALVSTEIAEITTRFRAALGHALSAGDALLSARSVLKNREWGAWLDSACSAVSRSQVTVYMRCAMYRDDVEAAIAAGEVGSLADTRRFLMGRPATGDERDPIAIAEAKNMRSAGASYQAIAQQFGIARKTAAQWCDPEFDEKVKRKQRVRQQREAALRRAQEADRLRAALRSGGDAAKAYELVRKLSPVIEGALADALSSEGREELRNALSHVHKAEDSIVRALKLGRT